jgi:DNA-directed RNA polymerase specialized sigma24 family protein
MQLWIEGEEGNMTQHGLAAASVRALLRQAQQGSEAAFRALYDNYKWRVFSTCLAITGQQMAAEELAKQIFVMIFRSIRGIRDEHELIQQMDQLIIHLAISHEQSAALAEAISAAVC